MNEHEEADLFLERLPSILKQDLDELFTIGEELVKRCERTSVPPLVMALLFVERNLRGTLDARQELQASDYVSEGLGEKSDAWKTHLAALEHELGLLRTHNEDLRAQLEGRGVEPVPPSAVVIEQTRAELHAALTEAQERQERAEMESANLRMQLQILSGKGPR